MSEKDTTEKTEAAATEAKDVTTEVALPVEIAQATLNYLVTRPYSEVAGLIAAIQQARPVK